MSAMSALSDDILCRLSGSVGLCRALSGSVSNCQTRAQCAAAARRAGDAAPSLSGLLVSAVALAACGRAFSRSEHYFSPVHLRLSLSPLAAGSTIFTPALHEKIVRSPACRASCRTRHARCAVRSDTVRSDTDRPNRPDF
eukprot:1778640-Prymnesium_polylepis.1